MKAYNHFIRTYEAMYEKAVLALTKDEDSLFSFYDFPAQHWTHIRTTNPIESTFATVRLRTKRTKRVWEQGKPHYQWYGNYASKQRKNGINLEGVNTCLKYWKGYSVKMGYSMRRFS